MAFRLLEIWILDFTLESSAIQSHFGSSVLYIWWPSYYTNGSFFFMVVMFLRFNLPIEMHVLYAYTCMYVLVLMGISIDFTEKML